MTLLDNPSTVRPSALSVAVQETTTPDRPDSEAEIGSCEGQVSEVSDAAAVSDALDHARQHARWFFWMWLLFAIVVSIGGNVMHAWMTAPATHLKMLAATAAAVPPAVLLGSTHSVALLIKTRRRGYRRVDAVVLGSALVLTVGVAGCAFALSFFSLRELMITLGIGADIAWLWPIGVDLSLICSTLAILTLTSVQRGGDAHDAAGAAPRRSAAAMAALAAGSGPSSPAERQLWWESVAAVVQQQHSGVRKIAELSVATIAEVLRRLYDGGDSQRSVCAALDLHHREVRTIKLTSDEVLARVTAPTDAAPGS